MLFVQNQTSTRSSPIPRRKSMLGQEESKNGKFTHGWGFSSMHALVNRERSLHNRSKLQRCTQLDCIAANLAQHAVDRDDLAAIDMGKHHLKALLGHHVEYGAQLVQVGRPTDDMRSFLHASITTNEPTMRRTILSRKYREFGLGTAMNQQGYLVLVQLFRS